MALLPSSPPETNAQNELMSALSALHLGGKYSDLTITCNYKQWAVHKAILCSRSSFFDGAFSHQFRESNSGVIDLSEDDEEAVEQMIYYFYHLDYLNKGPEQQPSALFRQRAYSNTRNRAGKEIDLSQIEDPLLAQAGYYHTRPDVTSSPPSSHSDGHSSFDLDAKRPRSPPRKARAGMPPCQPEEGSDVEQYGEDEEYTESESHLVLHTKVYALAEKYEIPSLKELARRKFEIAVACYYDAPELADAIVSAYTSTIDSDRGLRDVVLQLFRNHPQLANTGDVFEVIKQTPTLTLDLWKVERGLL